MVTLSLHLPTLSQALAFATGYVTACSFLVNVLPKDSVFNDYPRTKTAYNATVAIMAVSALNLRKFLPGANLKIPFLGFDQYQHDHPQLFAESVTESVTASTTRTRITGAGSESPAAATPSAPATGGTKPQE